MTIRKVLRGLDHGRDLAVVLVFSGKNAEGKFLVGSHSIEPELSVLVFDESADFHRHLATHYPIRPRGGGWLKIDGEHKVIAIVGRSREFGAEPDREVTRRALQTVFTGYTVTE